MSWIEKLESATARAANVFAGSAQENIPATRFPLIPSYEADKAVYPIFDGAKFVDEGLHRNVAIFACVAILSTCSMSAPFVLKRTTGKSSKTEVIQDHPFLDVLKQPNPETSGAAFIEAEDMATRTAGESYILKTYTYGNKPGRLDVLSVGCVDPIPDSNGTVTKYKYTVGGVDYFPDAREIAHVKYKPDPKNRYRGLGPIGILARQGDLDNRMADYLVALMTNAGIPAGILSTEEIIQDKKQFHRIRNLWKENYSGMKGWGNIAVLDGGWKYAAEAFSPKAMDLGTITGYTESRICAAFGVDPMCIALLIGLQHSTYSNKEAAMRGLWTQTVIPGLVKKAEMLTKIAQEWDTALSVEADLTKIDALKENNIEDRKLKLEEAKSNLITRDEYREETGRGKWPEQATEEEDPEAGANPPGIPAATDEDPQAEPGNFSLKKKPQSALLFRHSIKKI